MNLFVILTICIASVVIGYFIGYVSGFNKCRRIDDNIIEELTKKYKLQLEEMS